MKTIFNKRKLLERLVENVGKIILYGDHLWQVIFEYHPSSNFEESYLEEFCMETTCGRLYLNITLVPILESLIYEKFVCRPLVAGLY